MSAFDTTRNTASTTFTNAYGTIDLLPSGSDQSAFGFSRFDGWRYFEFKVEDQGGDNSKLFFGCVDPISTALHGGVNTQAAFSGGSIITAPPYNSVGGAISLSAETGDVFMFAVDMSGSGRNHAGTDQFPTTISNGAGTNLTPVFIEVGKNNVWGMGSVYTFAWPTGGYPMQCCPIVARDSTSLSAAQVSLRVETTSFAYAIPTGMIAWADGPAGGTSTSADATVYWDVTTADSDITLSASNFLAMSKAAGTSFSSHSVKTTALVATGKRVIEFWGNAYFPYGTSISAQTTDSLDFRIGICDADMVSISSSPFPTSTKIIWGDDLRRRGVSKASSMTNVQGAAGQAPQQNGKIYYFDFDTERLWQRGGLAWNNALTRGPWGGRTISATDGPNPYIGNDGMTFSVSTPGVRMIAWARKDYAGGNWVYINAGQTAFQTFPLLPGWKSMDGSRQVAGGTTYWDTSVMPTSLSVCFTGLAVRHIRSTADNPIARTNNFRSSGKYFFEIFDDIGNGGISLSNVVGLIPTSVGTFTANTIASIGAVGLWWSPGNRERVRYGTTLSYSNSVTWSSISTVGNTNAWWACAVDFDAGHVWFGLWNWNRQAIAWAVGADPAAGTSPDMTFTAGTAMHIASTVGSGWRYLVTESANVIGMPSGFTPWDGNSTPVSATATPSGTTGTGRVLWPYGVQT